jgi:putative membrane protein
MAEEVKQKTAAETQVELAFTRTLLASDRTLLAWIRTSLSLFGFGFTFAKFVHGFLASGALTGINAYATRNIGISMIVLGFAGLIGGIIEHYQTVKALNLPPRVSFASPALLMAAALAVVGIYLVYDIMSSTIK